MNGRPLSPLAFALALSTAALVGAQQGPPDDYLFSERIDVQLVNVEVWVTDGQGRPVQGLTADDFEILEDGEPVEISHFSEVRQGTSVDVEALARPEIAATPAFATATATEPSHLVIYFDDLHLSPAGRRRAIEDLSDFLVDGQIAPERVLILRQDRTLKTEVTFGSSWSELDAALSRIAQELPSGLKMNSEKRLALRSLQDEWKFAREFSGARGASDSAEATCQVFVPRAIPLIETYAAERRSEIRVSLDHLASAASFLTGVPGMKTLLYLSDSLERSPGADLVLFVRDLCPASTETPLFVLSDELGQEFHRLTRHANANRVTIYALQTSGLQASFLMGAANGALDSPGITGSFDVAVRASEREGLSTLAAETGGRTIFNTNDFADDLLDIAREISSYYSLAYVPLHGGDEGEHRIKVRMRGKNLRARHRRGYRDKSVDTRMTEQLQGAVYLGLVDNPLGVRLGAGSVSSSGKNRLVFPLHILVPAEAIVFLPADDGVVAQLSVQVSTRNTKDQKGLFDHRAYRIRWATESDQELVALAMDLEMPPGVHLVAVGVRDDATRETSFVSTTVEVHGVAPTGQG